MPAINSMKIEVWYNGNLEDYNLNEWIIKSLQNIILSSEVISLF